MIVWLMNWIKAWRRAQVAEGLAVFESVEHCRPALDDGRAMGGRLTAAVALMASLSGCASILPSARPAGGQTDVAKAVMPSITQALDERSKITPPKETVTQTLAKDLVPKVDIQIPRISSRLAEPRFDINVVNASPQQVLHAIVADTRYSMLVDPELKGAITLNLKDVTVKEALDAIRELYGFEYRITGSKVFVFSAALQTRVFRVNYLTLNRSGRSDVRVMSGSITPGGAGGMPGAAPGGMPGGLPGAVPGVPPGGMPGSAGGMVQESSRVTTNVRNDLWIELEQTLKAVVGEKEGRRVVVSPQTSTVIVTAMPREMRAVEDYLATARINIERQVMLEAKIVEVTLREAFQSGVNWAIFQQSGARMTGGSLNPNLQLNPSGTPNSNIVGQGITANPGTSLQTGNAVGGGLFGLAFQTGNFSSLLSFLETQGAVQVLSSPRIATLNNHKAVLKVGTDDFFVTNVTTTTVASGAGSTSSPSITVQPFFSGIALDVTPQIDEDNNIILHIHPSVSSVQERNKVLNLGTLGTITLPLASSSVNESDSIVRVTDGHIVAIGGLMRQEGRSDRAQIPQLGDSSAGFLFGNRSRSNEKQELVILIKPTVIRSDRVWDDERQEVSGRMRAVIEGDAARSSSR